MFSQLRQVFLDMDGTIYLGSRLFPTTIPFLEYLKKKKIGYAFLSNNSSYSTEDYIARLARLGIAAAPEDFYTSQDYTIDYLKNLPDRPRRLYWLGMDSVWKTFAEAGFERDDRAPERVIVGFDRSLTYEKLCRAAWHLKCGVPGIATHPDRFCPTDQETWLPDCGSFIACLETATGVKLKVLGKPDPGMLIAAAQRRNCTAAEVMMVGDRLGTDIRIGRNAHALTAWIISDTEENRAVTDVTPDLRVRDLGELHALLAEELGN